ncbi:hypothetical protein TOPH_04867, partial [Tolypocladium ophioglossoides CBS 100239]
WPYLYSNLGATQAQFQLHCEYERELDQALDELAVLEGQGVEASKEMRALQSLVGGTSAQQLYERADSCAAYMEQLVAETRSNERLAELLLALKKLQYPDVENTRLKDLD